MKSKNKTLFEKRKLYSLTEGNKITSLNQLGSYIYRITVTRVSVTVHEVSLFRMKLFTLLPPGGQTTELPPDQYAV